MIKIDIHEFEKLANEQLSRDDFFSRMLRRLVDETDAHAGVVWDGSADPIDSLAEYARSTAPPIPVSAGQHAELLARAAEKQNCVVVKAPEEQRNAPWLVFAPISGSEPGALLELIVPSQRWRDNEKQLISIVKAVGEIAASRCTLEQTDHEIVAPNSTAEIRQAFTSEQVSQFVRSVHQSIDLEMTCRNVANEARRLLDCDRVSVIVWQRGAFKIKAISGQVSVNRRSNVVHLLERLARKTLKTENPFWYPDPSEIPPQIENLLESYLAVSATRSLVIDPIFENATELAEDPETDRRPNAVIGGIIFEHCTQHWSRDRMSPALGLVAEHGGDSLRNSRNHQNLFLFPLWNVLGKSKMLMSPSAFPKSLMVMASLLLVAAILVLWRVPFYVKADGEFVPQQRQWVFSEVPGEIQTVLVEQNDHVQPGQTLMRMKNTELSLRIEETQGRIEALSQRLTAIESDAFDRRRRDTDEGVNSIKTEIESAKKQLEHLMMMKDQLEIESPIAGRVMTWDPQRKLVGRSVQPGQVLLEIADPEREWELELDVPGRRAGHLLRALERSQENEQALTVKFSLAADPSRTYEGTVIGASNSMRFSEDHQQVLRVRVSVDETEIGLKQARSGVAAKIYSGSETSIGYLWLHDIPETFNRYVGFYFAD